MMEVVVGGVSCDTDVSLTASVCEISVEEI